MFHIFTGETVIVYMFFFILGGFVLSLVQKFNTFVNSIDPDMGWCDANVYQVYRVFQSVNNKEVHHVKIEIENIDIYDFTDLVSYVDTRISEIIGYACRKENFTFDRIYIVPSNYDTCNFKKLSDIVKSDNNIITEDTEFTDVNKEPTKKMDKVEDEQKSTKIEEENPYSGYEWLGIFYKIK